MALYGGSIWRQWLAALLFSAALIAAAYRAYEKA